MRLGGKIIETEAGLILDGDFEQTVIMEPRTLVIIPPETPQSIELLTSFIKTKVVMTLPFNRADSFNFKLRA